MESKLVLHVKTRNIQVSEQPANTVQLCKENTGTVNVIQTTQALPAIIKELIKQHNLDNHAHPNLWYIHEQGVASAVWKIEHNLDRYPSVTIVDSAENVVVGYITYIDRNNVEVNFNGAFKGKAYLN